MRISDWSSDVCSSDLGQKRVASEICSWIYPGRRCRARERARRRVLPRRTPGRGTNRKRIRRILSGPPRRDKPRPVPTVADSSPQIRPKKGRSEEHTSELQSLMRISYAVFCLKKKTKET